MKETKWKKARLKKKMTQIEVAYKVGMSMQGYINIERGVSNPKPENEKKLKKVLGVE